MKTLNPPKINARQVRGLELAETVNIRPMGKGVGKWVVPSASSSARYTVDLNSSKRCTCPDFDLRRCKCKHIFAVEYTIEKQRKIVTTSQTVKGKTTKTQTVTETVTIIKRPTYSQNWPAYNAAQTQEKAQLQILLFDLCKGIVEPESTIGRPRLPFRDMLFSMAFKVYSTISGRRFMSDLSDAHGKGYLSKLPHYNSVFNYFEMPEITPILHKMIHRSSSPLKSIETDFAVDSSGFSGSKSGKWYFEKFNADKTGFAERQAMTDWLKLHLMCGVKTNIVTSVEISGRNDHDTKYLKGLVDDTAQRFTLKEVSADKAYASRSNLQAIASHKAVPYIAFPSRANGGALAKGEKHSSRESTLWLEMWRLYTFHTDQFMEHYHKRSNVESTFAMIKGKFGENLRSKTVAARTNEALCKVLCHNICCVIQSVHELGIEANFQSAL